MSCPDVTTWSIVYPFSIPPRSSLLSLASGPSWDLIINYRLTQQKENKQHLRILVFSVIDVSGS
jgi:hypothetical protein